MGFGKFYAIFMIALVVLVGGSHFVFGNIFGEECFYDIRYKSREGHDESVINRGKVYIFEHNSQKPVKVEVPNSIGMINPSLKNGEEYYFLGVDFESRGSIYKSVKVLEDYLNAIGVHDSKTLKYINQIYRIGKEREEVEYNLDKLAELDEEALSIAKKIDLSPYGELREVFLFTEIDTPNVNGKFMLANSGSGNLDYFYLQEETDIHIY